MSEPLAIIPTYFQRTDDFTVFERCAKTLKESFSGDIYVVDDGSPFEGSDEIIADLSDQYDFDVFYKEENTGFSSSLNYGLRKALNEGRDAVLINADVEFCDADWYEHISHNGAELVGGLLIYPNGTITHAGMYFSVIMRWWDSIFRGAPGTLEAAKKPRTCPITGALQFIPHSTLEKVGLYDEEFKLGYEDIDYCFRVFKSGGKCVYDPTVRAIHHTGFFRVNPSDTHVKWVQEGWDRLHKKYAGESFFEWAPTLLYEEEFA